jgi:hypothetical protein
MEQNMGNKEKTPITLDDVEYFYEDMNPQQQGIVNHIKDLNRKIGSMAFNLDQLNVGKAAFVKMLKESLESKPVEATEQ